MGLFDFLFGKKHISTFQSDEQFENEREKKYDDLRIKTEALRSENKAWQKEFTNIMDLREKGKMLEKDNRLDEAISIYLKSIELGEISKKLNISNYGFDINRVIVLYGKTNQKDLLREFLEMNISKYSDSNSINDWSIRLSKLKSNGMIEGVSIDPDISNQLQKSGLTLGEKIDDYKKNMPEFNFYYNMQEGSSTLVYNLNIPFEHFKKLRDYRDTFKTIESLARIAENEGDYQTAIDAYEKMILEKCEDVIPHERLIIIYSKLKLKEKEKMAVVRAILFFSQLKEKQLNYVMFLAEKYGMKEKALEYINQDKKIFYYGGAFELYNPQVNRLKKWNLRLDKLSKLMFI